VLFIPAAIGDALYAPGSVWSLASHRYVLLAAILLIAHFLIMKYTRVGELYGVAK
jgi:hypothetical protein